NSPRNSSTCSLSAPLARRMSDAWSQLIRNSSASGDPPGKIVAVDQHRTSVSPSPDSWAGMPRPQYGGIPAVRWMISENCRDEAQEAGVEVDGHDGAVGPHGVTEPGGDRAGPAADLEATPTGLDSGPAQGFL